MIKNETQIIDAARALNSMCDGAKEKDGQGFNKPDAERIKHLFWRMNQSNSLKDEDIVDIANRLHKYKGQLAGFGIDVENIEPVYEKATVLESWKKETVSFGKYSGKTYAYIYDIDAGYIAWLAENSFNKIVQQKCQLIMEGKEIILPEAKINGKKVNQEDYMILDLVNGDTITIKSSYNYKDDIKSLSDRRWNNDEKYWTAPIRVIEEVRSTFPKAEMTDTLKDFIEQRESLKALSNLSSTEINYELGGFGHGKEMFPYQKAGLHFLENSGGRALIADEMGLGKTIQALSYLQLHPEYRPVVIMCPASLKFNWRDECKMWLTTPDNIQILAGKEPCPLFGDIIIINYDIIGTWEEALIAYNPQVVIYDESHYLKNPKAKRTASAIDVSKNVNHRILLTGTPVMNRPKELWTQLHMVNPTLYPNDKFASFKFLQKYCDADYNGYGYTFNGASNIDQLADELKYVMIRRTKDEVLTELPEKLRTIVHIPISNAKAYVNKEETFKKWYEDEKIPEKKKADAERIKFLQAKIETISDLEVRARYEAELNELLGKQYSFSMEEITRLEMLKQMTAQGKIKAAIDWTKNFLDSGEKLVFFATHKKVIDKFMKEFGDCAVKIDGSVSQDARHDAVTRFQNDSKVKLFIGNIKAAGVGLTLTAASNVAFLELDWTPSAHDQAEDRCHRIGQENTVNVWYLLAENTIDDYIFDMISNKREIINNIMDNDVIFKFDTITPF